MALGPKLLSTDPADVAIVDEYKAIILRFAKMLDPNSQVSESHMVESIDALVDLEKALAGVSNGCNTENKKSSIW